MAVIAEDTRLTIATRLANLNYKEKLDTLQKQLNASIEARFIGKTPDDVLTCFKAHPKFFIRCNEASISSYNLPKGWFPEDWGSRTIYIHLKFSCEIPYGDEKVESYVGKLKDNDSIASLVKEYLITERDRYFMEKRLKCLMKMTRFTPARLQEEFSLKRILSIWISSLLIGMKRTTMLRSQHRTCATLLRIFVRH